MEYLQSNLDSMALMWLISKHPIDKFGCLVQHLVQNVMTTSTGIGFTRMTKPILMNCWTKSSVIYWMNMWQ